MDTVLPYPVKHQCRKCDVRWTTPANDPEDCFVCGKKGILFEEDHPVYGGATYVMHPHNPAEG